VVYKGSYVQRTYELSKDNMSPRTDIKIMADSDTVNNAISAFIFMKNNYTKYNKI